MIPQAHITAWRQVVPWADDAQVEQDLVLSRAAVELFAEPALDGKIALRGGTALHKLVVAPPYRYSEDIDLVQIEAAPIGSVIDAVRAKLDPWLGKPTRDRGPDNVTLNYRFESESAPVRPLRLKIEVNTREHFSLHGLERRPFSVRNPWFTGECKIVTFDNDELMATKLRALCQRRKGRDLFDLWLCLSRNLIDPPIVVACFFEYMQREGHAISRAQFEQNLYEKEQDRAFMSDIGPLLRPGLSYDSTAAMAVVRKSLIELLPGDPWRIPSEGSQGPRRRQKRG
ncbi:MAG: nucleotidyl transferase AbiEii/AbiGii toxin family protein [Planctomycetes bacterium]|nr:nucleotidyl transferase AbiEii/AbiGii toxin family protein [Planctomycetota bacterium]